MERVIAYPGQGITEADILNTNKNVLVGLAKLAAVIIGNGPALHSLPCTPGTGLSVQIGAGQIYQQQTLDASNDGYSSLGADSHTVLKQGLLLDPVTLNLPAPTTPGQSINYLLECQQQDVDGGATVLPFYNASNPSQTYQGPNNNGQASYTVRSGKCAVQAKAGTAAATGTQTTPTVDSGWVAAYVVTVNYGDTSISSGAISTASGAPFLTQTLAGLGSNAALLNAANVFTQPQTVPNAVTAGEAPNAGQIQSNSLDYGQDTGTANAYAVAYTPAITTLTGGMILTFKAANANTGAATFAPNGLAAKPILGGAHQALQGGEIVAGGKVELIYHATLASWILLGCTGGAVQVGNATQSQQAVPYGQVQTLVASASATYVNSATTLTSGKYLVDTSGGPFTMTLPASPTTSTIIELVDAAATWNTQNCTLARNGKTIEGLAEDLVLNVNDQRFIIRFNGSDWRLL